MKVPLKQEWMHVNPILDKMNQKWEENRRSDEIRIFHLKAIREEEFTKMEALEKFTNLFLAIIHAASWRNMHGAGWRDLMTVLRHSLWTSLKLF